MINYEILGRRIAQFRKEKSFTQEKLAEKANISNNYLSNIERNRSIPSLETLMSICGALGVTPNQILLGTDDKEVDYLSYDVMELFEQCSPQQKDFVVCFLRLLLSSKII